MVGEITVTAPVFGTMARMTGQNPFQAKISDFQTAVNTRMKAAVQ